MRLSRLPAIITAATAVAIGSPLAACRGQSSISVAHFEGWETWPILAPGTMALDTSPLSNQRIVFDAEFRGPDGPTGPSTMYMDVFNVFFQTEPAIWIQWTSSGSPQGPTHTAALDMLLVDRASFRVLFRIAAGPGDRQWGGSYDVTHHTPSRVVRINVPEDGATSTRTADDSSSTFDFASFQFLFPFLELREGLRFRMANVGTADDPSPRLVPIQVMGRTSVTDAHGTSHDVWEVQLMSTTGAAVVKFYVRQESPFFYGWDYRFTATGATISRMTFVESTSLTHRAPRRPS